MKRGKKDPKRSLNRWIAWALVFLCLAQCVPASVIAAENEFETTTDEVMSEEAEAPAQLPETDEVVIETEAVTEDADSGETEEETAGAASGTGFEELTENENTETMQVSGDVSENRGTSSDPSVSGDSDAAQIDGYVPQDDGYDREESFRAAGAGASYGASEDEQLAILSITGSYDVVSAQQILDRLNAIRQEAWDEDQRLKKLDEEAWNNMEIGVIYDKSVTENGVTTKVRTHVSADPFVPLVWSADLEEIADMRAVEGSIYSEHKRPNNKKWNSVVSSGSITSRAENLAWNYKGLMEGIEQWYAEKKDYINDLGISGTHNIGHYGSIINPMYGFVGIAAFRVKDYPYYTICQEFQTADKNLTKQDLITQPGEKTIDMEYDTEYASTIAWKNSVTDMEKGSSNVFSVRGTFSFPNWYYDKGQSFDPINSSGITWKSSDEKVVTCTAGIIKAVGTGSSTLTASLGDVSVTKKISVTAKLLKVNLVDYTGAKAIARGQSASVFVSYDPADTTEKDITWKSSNSAVATVDARGTVTGVKTGSAVISCTTKAGVFKASVTVKSVLEQITLSSKALTCNVAAKPKTAKLTPKYLPADSYQLDTSVDVKQLSWNSSDKTVAEVDSTGKVTYGTKAGTAVITCSAVQVPGAIPGECVVTVNNVYSKALITIKDPGDINDEKTAKELGEIKTHSAAEQAGIPGIPGDEFRTLEVKFTAGKVEDALDRGPDLSAIRWDANNGAVVLSKDSGFAGAGTSVTGAEKIYVKPVNNGLTAPATVQISVTLKNVKSTVKIKLTPEEGWQQDIYGEKRCYNSKGSGLKGWQQLGDAKYYFDSLGRMVTGDMRIGGKWYSFDGTGKLILKQGWDAATAAASTSFLDQKGYRLTGWQRIDASGQLSKKDGNWYYFDTGGIKQSGVVTVNKKSYSLTGDGGALGTGWQASDEYYYKETGANPGSGLGVRLLGLQLVGGERYFLTDEGKYRGLRKSGSWYYFSEENSEKGKTAAISMKAENISGTPGSYTRTETGTTVQAAKKTNGSLDSFIENGKRYTGWAVRGLKHYYLRNGVLSTGLVTIKINNVNVQFFFDKISGEMLTGGIKDGNTAYYTNSDGSLVTKNGLQKTKTTIYYCDVNTVDENDKPKPVEGFRKVGSTSYYLHTDGSMEKKGFSVNSVFTSETGAQTPVSLTFEFKDGQLVRAVHSDTISTGVDYRGKNGILTANGLYTLDQASAYDGAGDSFYFKKGLPQTGWINLGTKAAPKYGYFDPTNGKRKTGWIMISKKLYYVDPGTGYRLGEGWIDLNSKTYYLDKNGMALTGKRSLYGRATDPTADKAKKYNYYFDTIDGYLLKSCFVSGQYYADAYGKLR